jgi:hypothetical protein
VSFLLIVHTSWQAATLALQVQCQGCRPARLDGQTAATAHWEAWQIQQQQQVLHRVSLVVMQTEVLHQSMQGEQMMAGLRPLGMMQLCANQILPVGCF